MLAPDMLLQNRYLIVRPIAQGGMGAVYMARDERLHSTVALKETLFADERSRKAFEREAELLANLHHPALPNVSDHFSEGGGQFLVMQFIPGEDLGGMLAQQRGGSFPVEQVVGWADQLLDALDYLHAQKPPVIHRDIKPQNLKLTERGQIILLDFGLAKGTADAGHLSQNSSLLGYTLLYAPLEQIQSTGTDPRSDLYSLAATLYHLLTGTAAAPALVRATAVLGGRLDPLRLSDEVNAQVPPALSAVLNKALAQNPDERYATAKAMRQALRDCPISRQQQPGHTFPSVRPEATFVDAQPIGVASEARTVHKADLLAATLKPAAAAALDGEEKSHRTQMQPALTEQVEAGHTQVTSVRPYRSWKLMAALATLLIAVSLGVYKMNLFRGTTPAAPFQTMKISRLTTTGNAVNAAISPDGKYVVYAFEENGQQTLLGEIIATKSRVPLVAAGKVQYWGITFSRDGNYIYYVAAETSRSVGVLYQVAAYGGQPRKLIEQVDTPVTLSPDGERFAFVSSEPGEGRSLVVANKDGTERRTLTTRKYPDFFQEPSWSPDGAVIACVAGSYNDGFYKNLVTVNTSDGREQPLSTHRWWGVERAAWLPDGSGLIFATREQTLSTPKQVVYLSYPGGELRAVTNDLNDYGGVALSKDAGALVTIQSDQVSHVWTTATREESRARKRKPATDLIVDVSLARPVTSGKYDRVSGIAWTSDHRLVYASAASGGNDIWIMNADGSGQRQLTRDARINIDPAIVPESDQIIFASNRGGAFHLEDGRRRRQLNAADQRRQRVVAVLYARRPMDHLHFFRCGSADALEGERPGRRAHSINK
ncbi:MAG: protein kinase [Pyrinomonadaceae bacterium]